MTKYEGIEDIIIFGSFVKDKFQPQDIDIAIITQKRDLSLIGKISSQLPKKFDIENLLPSQVYKTHVGLSIISEGFSIKENKFLRDLVGIEPKKIYNYEIRKLTPSQKRSFNRALKEQLSKVKGRRLGAGCVMIPINKSGGFEEFLEHWDLKLEAKKYYVW